MTNIVSTPRQNAYKTNLSTSITAAALTASFDEMPSFSLSAGEYVYAVIDPKNSFREVVKLVGPYTAGASSITITRAEADYEGASSTAYQHSGGAVVVITNSWNIFDDITTAVNSKLDADGDGLEDSFNMETASSGVGIRDDAGELKLKDSLQAEVSLSTLAAAAGVDDKFKVSATDTTSSYADSKLTVSSGAGATVTKSVVNPGANETLNIDVALDAATAGVDEHAIYTPAYLTGNNAAEATFNNWLAVLDGEFAITIDGVAHDVTAIDFTGVTSMNDVASYIQTAIQTKTGGSETCVWSVDHFVITSGDTTATSAITVTSAVGGGGGTDISGVAAGPPNWMDCDVGVVTNAVRNDAADAGKLTQLDASGYLDAGFMPANLLAAAETGSTDITGTELEELSDGSTTSLHFHDVMRRLSTFTTTVNLSGTTSEETLMTFTVPGGALSTLNAIRGRIYVGTNNGNGGYNCTLRLKYGATTVAALVLTGNGPRIGTFLEFDLLSAGTTSSQKGSIGLPIDSAAGHFTSQLGTSAEDSTGDLALTVTIQWTNASRTGAFEFGEAYLIK